MSYDPKPPAGQAPPAQKSATMMIVLIVVGVIGVLGLCCVGGGVALLLPAVQAARQAAQRAASQNDLKELGLAYHNYLAQNGKAPNSWDDLAASGMIGPETIQKLQADNVIVTWGLDLNAAAAGPLPLHEFVLAHPSDMSGTIVSALMADGSVLSIPPDELQRRLQTQNTFPGPPPTE